MKQQSKTTKSSHNTKASSTTEVATSGTESAVEKYQIASVESTPREGNILKDEGQGEPVILREYKISVVPSKKVLHNSEILKYHRSNILSTLHEDGWEPLSEPTIKKHNATSYSIYVKAFIRRSMTGNRPAFTINEKPQKLQDIIK